MYLLKNLNADIPPTGRNFQSLLVRVFGSFPFLGEENTLVFYRLNFPFSISKDDVIIPASKKVVYFLNLTLFNLLGKRSWASKTTSLSIWDQRTSKFLRKLSWNQSNISEYSSLGFSIQTSLNIPQLSINLLFTFFNKLPTRLWPDASGLKILAGGAAMNLRTDLMHGNTWPSSKA